MMHTRFPVVLLLVLALHPAAGQRLQRAPAARIPLAQTEDHVVTPLPLDRVIGIDMSSHPLRAVLDEIARLGDIHLTYVVEDLATTPLVSLRASSIRVEDALNRVLTRSHLSIARAIGDEVVLVRRRNTAAVRIDGIVTGRVSDAEGHSLAGALVTVAGRSGIADEEGRYRITAVSEGSQVLVVRYVGFLPESTTVLVLARQSIVHDVRMEVRPAVLSTMRVTGQRLGQALALSQQQSASTIKNIVAAEEIAQLPDRNVAEALQRFPGVSVENNHGQGQNVLIRGLSPQFNNVTFAGVSMPSSAGGDRAVPLDLFASEMLGAIEVSKTLTPDMDANAIGGTINMVPRTPAEGPATIQAIASGGRSGQTGKGISQLAGLYGRRFATDNRLGILVGGNYYTGSRGSDDMDVSWVTKTVAGSESTVLDDLQLRDYDFDETRRGGILSADYHLSASSQFHLRGMIGDYEDNSVRRSSRVRFSTGTYVRLDSMRNGRIDRGLVDNPNTSNNGVLSFGGQHQLRVVGVDYDLSYARASRHQVQNTTNFTRRSLTLRVDASDPLTPRYEVQGADPDDLSAWTFSNYTNLDAKIADRDATAAINLHLPISIAGATGTFQFGGRVNDKHKNRTVASRNYDGVQGGLTLATVAEGSDDKDFFQSQYRVGRAPGVSEMADYFSANSAKFNQNATDSKVESDADAYDAKERVTAAYVMATMQMRHLTLIPGVRVEHTNLDYIGNEIRYDGTGTFAGTAPVAGGGSYTNVMPGVNARLAINDATNVRFAVTRSISRPLYGDIAPSRTVEPLTSDISLGNPALRPTFAVNADLLAERYSSSIGVLSAGFFYKSLTDFVFSRTFTYGETPFVGYTATQPQNGARAVVYGAEVNWQQQLTFLPGLLDGLGVSANYTLTESSAEIPGRERKAPLPGQARNVGNLALLYDKFGFAGRIATSLYGTNLTGVGATSDTDIFFDDHLEMDISASYRTRHNAQVFVELANLIDGPRRRYRGTAATPVEHEYYAPWMQVGVRLAR
jgi:TonB-dependent receptor